MRSLQAQGHLELERCPHCQVARPVLERRHAFTTRDHTQVFIRDWHVYVCTSCGSVTTASTSNGSTTVLEYFPEAEQAAEEIPGKAKQYLAQAISSLHSPAGAVMLAASSVDWMLKEKGYKEGSLYVRIEKAVNDHLITPEMGEWAHEVRLDANDQRHADEEASIPGPNEAEKAVDFAKALAEFLFVLPSRVRKGRGGKG